MQKVSQLVQTQQAFNSNSYNNLTPVLKEAINDVMKLVKSEGNLIFNFENAIEKVSKFLGIIGPIITSELVIFSLLDICNILFLEFSVSKTLTLTEIFNFFKSSIANKKPE